MIVRQTRPWVRLCAAWAMAPAIPKADEASPPPASTLAQSRTHGLVCLTIMTLDYSPGPRADTGTAGAKIPCQLRSALNVRTRPFHRLAENISHHPFRRPRRKNLV